MSIELLAMLGGSVAGFIMKLIAAQSEAQSRHLDAMIKKQEAADVSADKAAARAGGVWVRRFITIVILFAVVVAPFIVSFTGQGVSVLSEKSGGLFGFIGSIFGLGGQNWETVSGFVLLPEVRQGLLAILGFYFGSSQVK